MTWSADLKLIAGQLYKLGADGILCRCVLEHEHTLVLWEVHKGVAGGHNAGKETTWKVLCVGLWWPPFFKQENEYYKRCDICQRMGKPSGRD